MYSPKMYTHNFFSWTVKLIAFLLCSGIAFANPFEETIRILENRTAFHWGRDCFVWVVHYSEELVDPWVEAEAGRIGMSASERDNYRDSFRSDLSIDTSEPVLVTVHAFGARPLDFSPLSEKIALITQRGERVKPARYDRILDQPLSGIVQGLVFFPKQNDPDFAIAISGLGVYDERVFSFANEGYPVIAAPEEEEIEVIVVELPPAPAPVPNPTPRTQTRREPPPPPPPEQPREVIPEIAEPEIIVIEPEEKPAPEDKPAEPAESSVQEVGYDSREKTLRTFTDLWVKLDVEAMYSMLSSSSQKKFSIKTFGDELRKSQDFRTALRGGYTVDWLSSDQAKIVVVKRMLIIRTLLSKTLGVTREEAAWKIIW